MKRPLLALATTLTMGAFAGSYHLSTLPQPTEAQKNLITALNTIAMTGTAAIFGLLNDDDED